MNSRDRMTSRFHQLKADGKESKGDANRSALDLSLVLSGDPSLTADRRQSDTVISISS